MKQSTKALALYFCESSLYGSTFSFVLKKKKKKLSTNCLPKWKNVVLLADLEDQKSHCIYFANITQLNQMTKSYNWIFSSFLKQSKFWKSPENIIFIHSFVVVVDKVCWNYMFLGNILEHPNPKKNSGEFIVTLVFPVCDVQCNLLILSLANKSLFLTSILFENAETAITIC